MKTRISVTLLLAVIGFFAGLPTEFAWAQDTAKPATEANGDIVPLLRSVYRLEFVVREVEDGKAINSRTYTMSVKYGSWGKIRVGSNVPILGGGKDIQYQDVGINIDCKVELADQNLLLTTNFESSSIAPNAQTHSAESSTSPAAVYGNIASRIIRRVSFQGNALVALGKPTVIAKLADVATSRQYEVEVTATKVK